MNQSEIENSGMNIVIRTVLLAVAWTACIAGTAVAQRDLDKIPDPAPEFELDSFAIADGFEVNLYASDPLLAKPIHMNFDSSGRLWIASSEVYPQIKPGEKATDKIIVLDDTDSDGVADKRTVFADGLLIPTGVLPDCYSGATGCYAVNSTDLVHFADTDGDGVSDRRRVVLSGFGTEDTHHLLHTLRWGQDGRIYMNQSIYIHSHIETPHGVRHLNGGGIWRFRAETMQLDVLCRGLINPWGHHFDRWGQSFATDGAGRDGINYVFPNSVFVTAPDAKRTVSGLNPGSPKHSGMEFITGDHMPDTWQGSIVTNDFRGNRVSRFVVSEDGSGYASRQEEDLIRSSHVAFRPVDVKMGPDGAIYIADWYNPIIQHGEVDFRDSRRDHVHGRIWRVTAKGRPLVARKDIPGMSIDQLLDLLKSNQQWERLHARLELRWRSRAEVLTKLSAWTDGATDEHHRLEALWLYQTIGEVNKPLLRQLLASDDHRLRAAAVRVVTEWQSALDDSNQILANAVRDSHPQVRLEAISAFARVPKIESVSAAMVALDLPVDSNIDFALWQLLQDLRPTWQPAVQAGVYQFENNPRWLIYALQATELSELVGPLLSHAVSGKLPVEQSDTAFQLVAQFGKPQQLTRIFDMAMDSQDISAARRAGLLDALVLAAVKRKTRPAADLNRVVSLLNKTDAKVDPALIAAATRAAGQWQLKSSSPALQHLATEGNDRNIRLAALQSLGQLKQADVLALLIKVQQTSDEPQVSQAAFNAFLAIAPNRAIDFAAKTLGNGDPNLDPNPMLSAILARKGSGGKLAAALKEKSIVPDVARRAIRAVKSSSQQDQSLIAQLTLCGKLESSGWKPSEELTRSLMADVAAKGDPERGQTVYRRNELQCMNCHAIGGAGGLVGPDLVSIGGSAQVDYLIESLLAPNVKIKEGFHAKLIETVQGKIVSGVPVRRDDESVTLRLANDTNLEIKTEDIEDETDSRSLMPDGTVDTLTRQELVDLIAFLGSLGKVDTYTVDNARVARSWEKLIWTAEGHKRMNRTSVDMAATEDPAFSWASHYSLVSGDLPIADLPTMIPHRGNPPNVFVRTQLNVSTAGKIAIAISDVTGVMCWVDSKPVEVTERLEMQLQQGTHNITLAIDLDKRSAPVRLELRDVDGSPAQTQWATGK